MLSVATLERPLIVSRPTRKVSYNDTDFTIPVLNETGGYHFNSLDLVQAKVSAGTNLQQTTLDELNAIWNLRRFQTSRLPVPLGVIPDRRNFSKPSGLRILDLPIKFPGTGYRIPSECLQFVNTIKAIVAHEVSVNPLTHLLYAYLTIDQAPVKRGETQRKPGLHVDGFQGARIQPKLMIDHSYVVSDKYPTIFYGHKFLVEHLDESIHNFFLEFDEQAQEEMTWRPQLFEICLMNAYQIHRSDYATHDSARTFLRLSFTLRQFDRLGNTHNPLFNYNWNMVPRDTQTQLVKHTNQKEGK